MGVLLGLIGAELLRLNVDLACQLRIVGTALRLLTLLHVEMFATLAELVFDPLHDISWQVDNLTEGGLSGVTRFRGREHNLVLKV